MLMEEQFQQQVKVILLIVNIVLYQLQLEKDTHLMGGILPLQEELKLQQIVL